MLVLVLSSNFISAGLHALHQNCTRVTVKQTDGCKVLMWVSLGKRTHVYRMTGVMINKRYVLILMLPSGQNQECEAGANGEAGNAAA